MARLVYRWKRTVRALLRETAEDLLSLTKRDDAYKAKGLGLALFSTADRNTIDSAIVVLDNAFSATVPR